jgi:hypothetical protein
MIYVKSNLPAFACHVMCFKTHEALYMVSWYECQYIKGRYTGYPCVLKHMGLTPGYKSYTGHIYD